jgi:hypothetical protein
MNLTTWLQTRPLHHLKDAVLDDTLVVGECNFRARHTRSDVAVAAADAAAAAAVADGGDGDNDDKSVASGGADNESKESEEEKACDDGDESNSSAPALPVFTRRAELFFGS